MKELSYKQNENLKKYILKNSTEKVIKRIKENYKNYDLKPTILGLIFEKVAEIDKDGYSRTVYMNELIDIHKNFKTHNGNSWARSNTSYLGKKYNIIRNCKNGTSNGVYSVCTTGYNDNNIVKQRNIRPDILAHYHNKPCAVLDVISTNGMECDHKDGTYTTESNASFATQKLEDFQSFSKAVNDAKRQHCAECRKNGCKKRYDARRLGYSVSDVHINGQPFCTGCYWNDPQEFNRIISQSFVLVA